MATALQIQSEYWWQREIVTVELDWLGDELCRRTGQPRTAAGTKGNPAHLNGGHRSQEWILRSLYCTNRGYTVQPGLTAAQARHIAAIDFTPGVWGTARNRQLMVEQTGRLLAAMKAGELDELRELYGTVDGRTVTGWNNSGDRIVSSDLSHLDHWHGTIDRRHLTNRALMERIVAIALGDPKPEGSTMSMHWFCRESPTATQLYIATTRWRKKITTSEKSNYVAHASKGHLVLAQGEAVWDNLSCAGPEIRDEPAVDVVALADAIVAKLPSTALTAADVRAALADVLRHGVATEVP